MRYPSFILFIIYEMKDNKREEISKSFLEKRKEAEDDFQSGFDL